MLRREGFVSVKDAAELLGVVPNTVRSWGAAGKITEYRHPVNNYRMYKRTEHDTLIDTAQRPVSHRARTRKNGEREAEKEGTG